MLRGKRIMVILSSTLIFNTMGLPSTPFQALATEVVKDNNKLNEMVQLQDYRLKNFMEQYEKDKLELKKKKAEEEAKVKLEEQKKNEPQWQEFELTFYSSLNCENGYGSITSTGSKLFDGVVASNHYKINTRIKLQGWGEVTVLDRGSDKYFNNDYRLDVYIPREHGESDSHYFSRVNKMGKVKVKGCILK